MVLGLGAGLALDKIFRKGTTEVKPSETEVLTPQPQQIKSPTISIPKRIIQPPEQKPLNIWQRFFGGIFQGKEQDEPEIIPQRSVRPTLEDMRALTQKVERRKTYKEETIPTGLTAAQYQAQKEGRLVNAQSQGQLLVGLAANKFDYAGGEQQWSEWKTPGVEIRILGADKRLDVKGALDLATSIASDPTTYALGAPAKIGAKAVGEAGEIAGKAISEGAEVAGKAISKTGKELIASEAGEINPSKFLSGKVSEVSSGAIPPIEPPKPPVVEGGLPSGRKPGGEFNIKGSPPIDNLKLAEEALEPETKTLMQKLVSAKDTFVRSMYQSIRPLKNLENKVGGDAWKAAKVVPGARAWGERIVEKTSNPIYQKVGKNLKDFATYLTLKRNEDILAHYGQATKLPNKIGGWASNQRALDQLAKKLGAKRFAEIEDLAKEYYKINDEYGLGALKREGLIDEKEYLAIKSANPHYVPFYRQGYDEADDVLKSYKSVGNVSSPGIKSMEATGSDRKLMNVLAAHDADIVRVQSRIAQNKAAREIVESIAQEKKLADDVLEWVENPDIPKDMLKPPVKDNLTDTISFFKDGKKYTANVPRIYAVAAKALEEENVPMLLKIIQKTNMPLQKGAVVYNPFFLPTNLIRDLSTAFTTVGLKPLSKSHVRGIVAAVTKNALYDEAIKNGALLSGITETMLRPSSKITSVGRSMGGIPLRSFKDWLLATPRLVEKANVVAEQSTRVATYDMLRGKGLSPLEAAVKARDATVDFAQSGTLMKSINMVIPFSNASLQGTVNLFRAFKNNPKLAIAAGAAFTVPTVLSRVYNMRYESSKKIPYYEYTNYWVFQIGEYGEEGDKKPLYIKIPKGQTAALMTFPAEAIYNYRQAEGDKSLAKFVWEAAVSALEAASPVPTDVSGVLPSAPSTAVELATNRNIFTGQDIVPQSEQNLLPEQQYGVNTGKLSVSLGQILKTSPRLIDYAIKDYTAGTGQLSMYLLDLVFGAAGYNPPVYGSAVEEPEAKTIPGVSRFVGNKATQQIREGYENFDDAKEKTNREFNKIPDMNRLGIRLGDAGGSIKKAELTPQQRAIYQGIIAEIVIPDIQEIVQKDFFKELDDEKKVEYLKKRIGILKERAKKRMWQEHLFDQVAP